MAERLIRESDVVENIDEWLETVGYATIGKGLSYYAELKGCITDAPTIEAKPVVHAHWISRLVLITPYTKDDYEEEIYNCSNCNMTIEFDTPYCPYCGAQMDEKESD